MFKLVNTHWAMSFVPCLSHGCAADGPLYCKSKVSSSELRMSLSELQTPPTDVHASSPVDVTLSAMGVTFWEQRA
jgi:hypothetical protein